MNSKFSSSNIRKTYFEDEKTIDERKEEASRMYAKYKDRVCIIVQRSRHATNTTPYIDRRKYMASKDMEFGYFQSIIRKRLDIRESESLIFFINDVQLITPTQTISELYSSSSAEDSFLYVYYTKENTFGSGQV